MNKREILIEKNYNGNIVASAIIDGCRLHRVYIGYSKTYVRNHFYNNPPK